MNYSETVEYLYTRLPMFSRDGSSAYKKDLTNTIALCTSLKNPHLKFKSLHVGGTNGKGSVSHMVAAVLQTAGYKTGLYTSPHLYDFRERIKVNGALIPEPYVVDFVKNIKHEIERIEPSFFEITVAMAFQYFADEKVDFAVIEVGLGGRLDSTNIITPELSIITNIGFDHMNMLGNTLEEIALEKGGIIKNGIPIIIGESRPETSKIFSRIAKEKESPIFFAEDEFKIKSFQWEKDNLEIEAEDVKKGMSSIYTIDLPGIYQTKNICTTLTALKVFNEKNELNSYAIKEGLSKTKKITNLLGRWDVIKDSPKIILEVAHNKDGIEKMLEHLELLNYDQLHLVIGFVKDKEIESILSVLPTNAHYYFTQAKIPRALGAYTLQEIGLHYNLNGDPFENVNNALSQAIKKASQQDLIIVCGSIFLVAEVDRNLAL